MVDMNLTMQKILNEWQSRCPLNNREKLAKILLSMGHFNVAAKIHPKGKTYKILSH